MMNAIMERIGGFFAPPVPPAPTTPAPTTQWVDASSPTLRLQDGRFYRYKIAATGEVVHRAFSVENLNKLGEWIGPYGTVMDGRASRFIAREVEPGDQIEIDLPPPPAPPREPPRWRSVIDDPPPVEHGAFQYWRTADDVGIDAIFDRGVWFFTAPSHISGRRQEISIDARKGDRWREYN